MSHDRSKKWQGEPEWDDESSIENANTEQLLVPFDEELSPMREGRSPAAPTRLIEAPADDAIPAEPLLPSMRKASIKERESGEVRRDKVSKSNHPVFGGAAAGGLQPTQVGRVPSTAPATTVKKSIPEGIGKPRLGLGALANHLQTPETQASISAPPSPIPERPRSSRPGLPAAEPASRVSEKPVAESAAPATANPSPSSESAPQSAITTAKFVPPPPVSPSPSKNIWETLQLRSSHRTWLLFGMTVAALMLAIFVDREPGPQVEGPPAQAPAQGHDPYLQAPQALQPGEGTGLPNVPSIKTFRWDSLAWPTDEPTEKAETKMSTKKAVDLLMSGKREEAIQEYDALTERDPTNQIYTTIGRILRKEVAESCKNGIHPDGTPCDSKPESK